MKDYKNIYTKKKSNDEGDESDNDDDDDDTLSDTNEGVEKPCRQYSSESVSAWMRRSSGFISDDHLTLFHAKLLNDAVKLCASTNDITTTLKASDGVGKRSNSANFML